MDGLGRRGWLVVGGVVGGGVGFRGESMKREVE